jgi:HEAT repeat protein
LLINQIKTLEDASAFLEPAIQFLQTERNDRARAWGTNVLEAVGGERADRALTGLLDEKDSRETKRAYFFTRFFALRGLQAHAAAPPARTRLKKRCRRLLDDEEEDLLVRCEAAAILANLGDASAMSLLRQILRRSDQLSGQFSGPYWPILRTARALVEIPVPALADDLLSVVLNLEGEISSSANIDHIWQVTRTLAKYPQNPDVLPTLIKLAQYQRYSFIREEAVISLGRLGDPAAAEVLLASLQERSAEIRYQAALALKQVLPVEKSVAAIVQAALDADLGAQERAHLLDALRLIDPDRNVPTEMLSRALGAEDRARAELAEQLLIDLGGWTAVQRLSQRRTTLNRLDSLLSDSEKVVRDTFEGTIRQARLNFYFAMSVNVLIVLTGIALVVLAIFRLVQDPSQLASWILPGATGVLGVLINLAFNNPRHNARNDLTTLLNVNVIFLGYLRQLNEIDATFKHTYLEDPDFNSEKMRDTVQQIHQTMTQTLEMVFRHFSHPSAAEEKEQAPTKALEKPPLE